MKLDYDTDQKLIRYFNQGILDARTASEIQGIAAAIVYDDKVDEGEVAMLAGWMERTGPRPTLGRCAICSTCSSRSPRMVRSTTGSGWCF